MKKVAGLLTNLSGIAQMASHVFWENKTAFLLPEDTYEDWVMFAAEEGRFQYSFGKHNGSAGFGDLIICPPHTPFARKTECPLTFHFITFQIKQNKDSWPELPVGKIKLTNLVRMKDNFAMLRRRDAYPQSEMNAAVKNHITSDLWLMACLESVTIKALRNASDEAVMHKAAERMRQEALGPIHLRLIAEETGYSPVQFTRKFRSLFQVNPIDYITALRMEHASRLLTGTELSLEQIAEQCGYQSGFYLSRIFKRRTGFSPSAYRDRNRL